MPALPAKVCSSCSRPHSLRASAKKSGARSISARVFCTVPPTPEIRVSEALTNRISPEEDIKGHERDDEQTDEAHPEPHFILLAPRADSRRVDGVRACAVRGERRR